MKGFISIILDPTRLFPDWGVVDLEKQTLICRTSSEREADRIADALVEAEHRKLEQPIGLITEGKP